MFLSTFIPFGPERIKLLLSYFGSAERVWNTDIEKLLEINIPHKTAEAFIKYKRCFNKEAYLSRLRKLNIKFVTYQENIYPENLKGLEDIPIVLYYRGNLLPQDKNSVAIVGSRKMTSYGKEVTEKFANELAGMEITIISGLALGIDAVAHTSALNCGGRGIAVLPTGLDTITPLTNYQLGMRIIREGALVSEYPLNYPAFRTNFARRNRIISGLSKAVIVIEGEERSGTLLTASAAADQGRQVFAVPGQITSPMSAAPHYLIKNGAKIVTCVRDILEELELQLTVDYQVVNSVLPQDAQEELLYKIIEHEQVHLDELARITGLAISEISARLTIMELRGMVKNIGNGVYKKT